MKRKSLILSIFAFIICFCGCAYRLEKPENTNLEFWITQEMDSWYPEGYQQKYGMFGGSQFYGSTYEPTYDEHNQQTDPEFCVIYTITSYPDHSSKPNAITHIYISDPAVYVYGLTLNSSEERIKGVMAEEGYKHVEGLTFVKGKVSISFGDNCIRLNARVTNKYGIIF